jgi:hypothetical protein
MAGQARQCKKLHVLLWSATSPPPTRPAATLNDGIARSDSSQRWLRCSRRRRPARTVNHKIIINRIIIFTIHCVAADMNHQTSNKIVYEIGET